MCGRYGATNPNEIKQRFPMFKASDTLRSRYNIAPTQNVIIAKNDGRNEMTEARWGLIPSWAASIAAQKIQPINAKVETIAQSRLFAPLLKKKRCIIFADAFFEWKHEGKRKVPYCFRIRGGEAFAFAGLWDTWHDEITSCTIITGEPNALVAPIHDRMPMILDPDIALEWLSLEENHLDHAFTLLQPYPAERMEVYQVSSEINASRYDGPEAITPVADLH